MIGLGATLTSLVRNCSDSQQLTLWFLCSKLTDHDKKNIRRLLDQEGFKGSFEFVDFDAKKTFGHLIGLHGDWTTYGRLLIPGVVLSEKVLYLDSDLIINADILELKNFPTDNEIAAVSIRKVEESMENRFLSGKLQILPGTGYFNAGVLLFNTVAWRENNFDKKLKEITDNYPNELLLADQTLLNAACQGKFRHLPAKYNLPWYPDKPKPVHSDYSIIHFVGSPKPWDFLGKQIHAGYKTWEFYNTPFWKSKYGKVTAEKLKRTFKIRRSLLKHLGNKITGNKIHAN